MCVMISWLSSSVVEEDKNSLSTGIRLPNREEVMDEEETIDNSCGNPAGFHGMSIPFSHCVVGVLRLFMLL